jgi:hypothetical protein
VNSIAFEISITNCSMLAYRNQTLACLSPFCSLVKLTYSSSSVVDFMWFSAWIIIYSTMKFYLFPLGRSFIYFSCLTTMATTANTMLNRSSDLFLFFSLLYMMWTVRFSWMSFIKVRSSRL